MQIKFKVKGYPPKKRGDKSMWNNDIEVDRVIELRRAALIAREKAGLYSSFKTFASISLSVFLPPKKLHEKKDLDNFVSGICDGLQSASNNTKIFHKNFQQKELTNIHPKNDILIEDDSRIVEILARKIVSEDNKSVCYEVVVEPVEESDLTHITLPD